MKTSIFTEVRIMRYKGKYYCDQSFYKILKRYLNKFDNITLFTRVVSVTTKPMAEMEIEFDKLRIYNIESITSFLIKTLAEEVKTIIVNSDLIILRMPSIISIKIWKLLRKNKKDYLCEVMGCAFDAYWNHGVVGKIIAIPMFVFVRKVIRKSNYCIYVTEKFLQKRYPTKAISINASNVDLNKIETNEKYQTTNRTNIKLFTAAALNVKYKGQQFVIKAIPELEKKNIHIDYYLAGKGDNQYLEKIARRIGVQEKVHFLGMLDKNGVLEKMKDCDIYIQPSLQEGLPRAVIEAMSCGCVCLGSNTAGIPELIESKCIFKRKSSRAIVKKIESIIKDNFKNIEKRNREKAKEYLSTTLDNRRDSFFDLIREKVQENEDQ